MENEKKKKKRKNTKKQKKKEGRSPEKTFKKKDTLSNSEEVKNRRYKNWIQKRCETQKNQNIFENQDFF